MASKYSFFKGCRDWIRLIFLISISLLVFLDSASANGVSKDSEALFSAVRASDLESVRLLVGGEVDVNIADEYGITPLDWAVINEHLEIAELLLGHGADANIADSDGKTPLYRAVDSGYLEIAELLLNEGADGNIANPYGKTPLYRAVDSGYLEIAKLLLSHGAGASIANQDGKTLLHSAMTNGYLEIAKLLLSYGADANTADPDGTTPLYRVVTSGYLEIAELLLSYGADVNVAGPYGSTLLDWAVTNGHLEMAQLLLSYGANANVVGPYGSTPLYWAVTNGHLEMAQLLLSYGADANIASQYGFTPLYRAVYNRCLEMLTLLLDRGAIMDVSVAKKCFEVMSVDALQNLLRRRDVQSAIGGFSQDDKRALLDSLSVREFAVGAEMMPLIELFEAQFGVRREDVNVATDEWGLSKVLIEQGVDAAKELIADKVCIGIVTARGLSYDNIIKAAKRYELAHPEFAFYYVNQEVVDSLGVDAFSGLIFPGAGDNYPKDLSEFTLADMPDASRTETEMVYQYVYERAQLVGVPTLGVCAGAQHLALHRGAALTPNKTNNRSVKMIPFRVPYFLSLSTEERKALLEYCDAPELRVNVFRAHSYSAVTESLQEQGFALGLEDGVTPLAFYQGFDVLGIQFHPEARYEGIGGNYGDAESRKRQTNLLNGFFELCASYQGWINWGRDRGICREDALMMRDGLLQGILERLAECEENPDSSDREGAWYEEEILFQAI